MSSRTVTLLAIALVVTAPAPALWMPAPAQAQSQQIALDRQQIREVQRALNALGYDAGPADGLKGPRTLSAIQAFRASNGYDVDAPISTQLLERLAEARNRKRDGGGAGGGPAESTPDPADGDAAGTSAGGEPAAAAGAGEIIDEPAGAQEETPPAARLVGTSWRFTDANGAQMALTFRADGRIERKSRIQSDWSWRWADDRVVVEYDSGIGLTSTRRGRIVEAGKMRGTGSSSTGDEWTWTAERIDAESGG